MGTYFVRKIARMAAVVVIILAIALTGFSPAKGAYVTGFTGQWQAVNREGGDIRLTVASGMKGVFLITWTESDFSLCGGGPGIARGMGAIDPQDENLLEATLSARCLLTNISFDFQIAWRYHPETNLLSSSQDGFVTLWHRPGKPPVAPRLDLRVNYGGDWVESFYEAGHTAWVTVFASDGVTVKATSQLITEPKDYWGGETGFQTMDAAWYDADGNLMNPPNIRPYDWVYGWIDNGASARVQIGDIRGVVDLTADAIGGAILADWFSDEVSVECFPWGAPEPQPEMKYDSVLPDGMDAFACSWAGEWDIQNGQVVGVGYFGADSHWVANEFRNPRFDVFPDWNFVEGWEWPEGDPVSVTVAGKEECAGEGTPGYMPENPWSTYVGIGFPEGCDIAAGDEVTLTNGTLTLSHVVRELAIGEVSAMENWVLGTSAPDAQLSVWAHGFNDYTIYTAADGNGDWGVDFDDVGFDLQAGMAGRAQIVDELGNATAVDWMVPETLIVTSTADALANDGECTLREAVIAANTNAPSGDLPGECPAGLDPVTDTILLMPDQVYSLTIDSTYEDDSLDGDLDFWDNSAALDVILTVADGGRAIILQNATVDDRVLHNLGPALRLENITLSGGNESGSGGGIMNHSTLDLVGVGVTENTAADAGGGIFNLSVLNLTDCYVGNNSADWGGGIVTTGGTLVLDASAVAGNTSVNDAGGIFILDAATVTIQNNSQVVFNTANWGGGVSTWGSTVTIDGSAVAGNTANNSGGGLLMHEGGSVTVQNGSVFYGNAANWGGGLSNWDALLTITDSTISGNQAFEYGGGLENGGTLSASGSAFLGNTAWFDGGAVWSFTEIPYATTVTNSCFTGNSVTAVVSPTGAVQNFTLNWWGDPSGPGGSGPGLGDTVGAYIDYADWLVEAPPICAVTLRSAPR